MKGKELLKLLKRYAAEHSLAFDYIPNMGKGGHGGIYLGDKRSIIPSPHKEIKTGTALAIIKQLGLTKADLGL